MKGKAVFEHRNMPISGSGSASAGAGGSPISSGIGSAKPPTGGKQTSGPANKARQGKNLAGKDGGLNGFPAVGSKSPKIQS